jgi:hypothetical protein
LIDLHGKHDRQEARITGAQMISAGDDTRVRMSNLQGITILQQI